MEIRVVSGTDLNAGNPELQPLVDEFGYAYTAACAIFLQRKNMAGRRAVDSHGQVFCSGYPFASDTHYQAE